MSSFDSVREVVEKRDVWAAPAMLLHACAHTCIQHERWARGAARRQRVAAHARLNGHAARRRQALQYVDYSRAAIRFRGVVACGAFDQNHTVLVAPPAVAHQPGRGLHWSRSTRDGARGSASVCVQRGAHTVQGGSHTRLGRRDRWSRFTLCQKT